VKSANRKTMVTSAIISQGQPQLGDRETFVLAIGVFETYECWYDRMLIERPWETRN
jgi:hypothetical protein